MIQLLLFRGLSSKGCPLLNEGAPTSSIRFIDRAIPTLLLLFQQKESSPTRVPIQSKRLRAIVLIGCPPPTHQPTKLHKAEQRNHSLLGESKQIHQMPGYSIFPGIERLLRIEWLQLLTQNAPLYPIGEGQIDTNRQKIRSHRIGWGKKPIQYREGNRTPTDGSC